MVLLCYSIWKILKYLMNCMNGSFRQICSNAFCSYACTAAHCLMQCQCCAYCSVWWSVLQCTSPNTAVSCNAKCLVDWSACSSLVPGAEEEELLSLFVKAEGFCQLSRFLISYLHLLGTISQTNILDIQTSAGVPLLIRKNVVLAWFKNEKEALKNVVIS